MGGWPFKSDRNFESERVALRDKMRVSGEITKFSKTENWIAAFHLYETATGKKTAGLGCSVCQANVVSWLNA